MIQRTEQRAHPRERRLDQFCRAIALPIGKPATDDGIIMIVLSVILPEAQRTNVEAATAPLCDSVLPIQPFPAIFQPIHAMGR